MTGGFLLETALGNYSPVPLFFPHFPHPVVFRRRCVNRYELERCAESVLNGIRFAVLNDRI